MQPSLCSASLLGRRGCWRGLNISLHPIRSLGLGQPALAKSTFIKHDTDEKSERDVNDMQFVIFRQMACGVYDVEYAGNDASNRIKTESSNPSARRDSLLLSKAQPRPIEIEHNVLALEEAVPEDAVGEAVIALDEAEAIAVVETRGAGVDVAAGQGGLVRAEVEGEVGDVGGAGPEVEAVLRVVERARDLGVVLSDNVRGEDGEAGARVGDGVEGRRLLRARRADLVRGWVQAPLAQRVVDGGVADGAGVLCAIDEAEVVGSSAGDV